MKDIETILADIGITIPEGKAADLRKAVAPRRALRQGGDLSHPQIVISSQLRRIARAAFLTANHFHTLNRVISILVSIFARNRLSKRKIFFRFQTFLFALPCQKTIDK